jgi:dinuclear metal center YbgI/SA1388 family protein
MAVRVKDILRSIDGTAPFSLAESWDNVGLLVGDAEREVSGVLIGLDPTTLLLDEAIARGVNTVVTHHPIIFKPLQAINTATAEGRLLEKALSNKLAIIAAHTNFDSAVGGVSAVLARHLGLGDLAPLLPVAGTGAHIGLGCIGSYGAPITAGVFRRRLLQVLQLQRVRMVGTLPETISVVAICGGSGSEFAPQARDLGAQVYLSAEIKHSTAIWAVENGFCVIDGSHYATEKPAVAELVSKLQETARNEHWPVSIFASTMEHHPFLDLEENNLES